MEKLTEENKPMLKIDDEEEKFACITPTVENLSATTESFTRVLTSHNWDVNRIEQQTPDQILVQIICRDCGLNRISIVSDIADSEARAKLAAKKMKKEKDGIAYKALAEAAR